MQLDRLMTRAVTRIAKSGLTGLRAAPQVAPSAPAPKDDLRGSGSWANEWAGSRSAVERAKSLAGAGRRRGKANTAPVDVLDGTIRAKPLMSVKDVKLHNWIADRLEAEAPTCSLHAGVALRAFLVVDEAFSGEDPIAGLVADLLIADATGQPVAVIQREDVVDAGAQMRFVDALLDADIPIIDLPGRPSLSQLWSEISECLPQD